MYVIVTDLKTNEVLCKETIDKDFDSTRAELLGIKRALDFAYYGCTVWNDNHPAVYAINDNFKTKLEPLAEEIRKIAYERNIQVKYWDNKKFGKIPSDCKYKFGRERRHSWKLKKQKA
jgi:hypothetical protein